MTIVDLSACTVFPALVDSHVHLVMSGTTTPALRRKQLTSTYADRRDTIAKHLRQHLRCGVLAVRDGGDHNGDTLRYKGDADPRSPTTVTVASPGRARHAPGRYGKLIGIPVEAGKTLVQSAFGENTRRDHLKLVNSGLNSLTQFGVESAPQFDESELAAVVAEARKRGLSTMVHANGHQPVKLAVLAGCSSIEHGFFMGKENMRRLADTGVVWVPTAVTMKAYGDYLKNQGHRSDPSFADVSRKNLEHQLAQIHAAREMGVTLALGTDAGSPGVHHGSSVQEELRLFISAGYSVEGAIRCASRNGALLMGLPERGKLAPGMRADFMAVKGPVAHVPDALHQIVCRVVEGREIGLDPAGQ
ncbi:amidohydrolase [Desulfosarcina alkanivorans]|uniref:Amidohydrolase n=1 Tax=Desulfosarcina alkanivorans TaxID=571177 RepID=A0A5K7YR50_9BACT|nr:amidohydrolase family protein [Desulfosarcina alkanivorans]BBO67107.1 amidohydrolase [Desulfosarcina alkanivorans]